MDWCSWLSNSSLDPSLASDYGLLFTNNELEQEDIPYFDHEFLKSMGISIAKHRLEILKLARKDQKAKEKKRDPMAGLLNAMKKAKKSVSKYFSSFSHRNLGSAIVVVPRPSSYSCRWTGSVLKSTKGMVILKQGRLMITNGSSVKMAEPSPTDNPSGAKEIRWDSMFEDLKPT